MTTALRSFHRDQNYGQTDNNSDLHLSKILQWLFYGRMVFMYYK